ncbi:MAG: sodium:alanine symporter family protein [Bacteroidetes bacterium]|nr:sodium:alanine symporter family protein [Bacteroidota bacterium]
MLKNLFQQLFQIEDFLWSYIALPAILLLGIYFTVKLKLPQITKFKDSIKIFYQSLFKKNIKSNQTGIPPLRAFFTSIGGCIGIGNLVGVCTAVKIGGPGAVFWMWVAAFLGIALKYSEVYLGIKFRVKNKFGTYNGGPMYYLQKISKNKFLPYLAAFLLCIYGTEIYMFSVVVDSINTNLEINKYIVIGILLFLVLYAGSGGISRVGQICSYIIPIFLVIFIFMSSWIFYKNSNQIIDTLITIFKSAFTGHAAIGGFTGSTILLAMSQGMARGCYTGDIGIGYASVVHAESSFDKPEKQASLTILGIVLDTFIICTFNTLIILITGIWKTNVSSSLMTQMALSNYFPYMKLFMPIFIGILGYSTIIAFFAVGLKSAEFISPKCGKKLYYCYAIISLILFSFVESDSVLTIMSICGALLLFINVYGIYKLRKEIFK